MAKNIKINGVTYSDVPALKVKDTSNQDVKYYDISDTTAQASHVLTGDAFYNASGSKISGAMPNMGAVAVSITLPHSTYTVPAGYHNGSGAVTVNIPEGTEGTPTLTLSVSKSSGGAAGYAVITPEVTNTSGYITGGSHDGTTRQLNITELMPTFTETESPSADEIASGRKAIDGSGKVVTGTLANYRTDTPISSESVYVDAVSETTPVVAFSVEEVGRYAPGAALVAGLADVKNAYNTANPTNQIISDNIKAGVNIMGVTGKTAVVDTSDANAQASNITKDKIAYVNGVKVTGTLTSVDVSQDTVTKVVTIL